jgi:hypothetical protein
MAGAGLFLRRTPDPRSAVIGLIGTLILTVPDFIQSELAIRAACGCGRSSRSDRGAVAANLLITPRIRCHRRRYRAAAGDRRVTRAARRARSKRARVLALAGVTRLPSS